MKIILVLVFRSVIFVLIPPPTRCSNKGMTASDGETVRPTFMRMRRTVGVFRRQCDLLRRGGRAQVLGEHVVDRPYAGHVLLRRAREQRRWAEHRSGAAGDRRSR